MKYVDSIHDCVDLADEKIRLIKANIVKEVDFEQQLAVGRLRGPEGIPWSGST